MASVSQHVVVFLPVSKQRTKYQESKYSGKYFPYKTLKITSGWSKVNFQFMEKDLKTFHLCMPFPCAPEEPRVLVLIEATVNHLCTVSVGGQGRRKSAVQLC